MRSARTAKMIGLIVGSLFLLWLSSYLHRLTVANFEFDKKQALQYDLIEAPNWPQVPFAIK